MSESTENNKHFDSVLGKLVVEQGLATDDEIRECLGDQSGINSAAENDQSLAAILVSKGFCTKHQIKRIRPKAEERSKDQQIPGYKIIKPLGAGAMARVYLATQLSLNRQVAIKVLPQKFTKNPQFVDRFYEEGRAAAKLNHPGMVAALDVGKAGDYHYFVMEYVEGDTVFQQIQDDGAYSEKDAIRIMIQTAKALEHAHQAGLIHRDVKPKNMMITTLGDAKLMDLGLARSASDKDAALAEKGKAYGTPYYIAPEQIRGQIDVDYRCDIYSLGATLYHMVTGRVPFDGENPSAVMHKHLKEPLTPPDHINPKLSSGLSEVIEVCMAKNKTKRYTNCQELLEDLVSLQNNEVPMIAHTKFDISNIQNLGKGDTIAGDIVEYSQPRVANSGNILAQPIYIIAIIGWVLALIFLILFGLYLK